MYCYKCGALIEEGDRFCLSCGSPVEEPDAAQTAVMQPVPAPTPDLTLIERFAPEDKPYPSNSPASAGSKALSPKKLITIAVVAVAVIVLVIAGIAYTQWRQDIERQMIDRMAASSPGTPSSSTGSNEDSYPDAASTPDATKQEPVPTPSDTQPKPEEKPVNTDYVIADSSTRYLSRTELESMSDHDLYLARNEVFARHGRAFLSEELQQYFGSKSWYSPRFSPSEFDAMASPLNSYEKDNTSLMLEIEKSRNSPYLK